MIQKSKSNSKVLSLYIRDVDRLQELYTSIRHLWFLKYGETLTKADCILKGMIFLESYLKGSPSKEEHTRKRVENFFRFSSD